MNKHKSFSPNNSLLKIICFSIIINLLLICGLISSAKGQTCGTPGNLDLSFGNSGIVKTDFRNTGDAAQSVAIQSDGKIVAGGFSYKNGTSTDFSLSRYNIDGSLDVLFGNGGKVITVVTVVSPATSTIISVKIQPNGKIVAGGQSTAGATVVRYNADGSLDTTFGNNGVAITSLPSVQFTIKSMAMQPDGKIVLVGSIRVNNDFVFVVVRFNANGTLDATFGNNGLATTNFAFDDFAEAIDVTTDGKIVAAGVSYLTSGSTGSRQFAVARYNSDGSPDVTFGNGGKVTTAANPGYSFNQAFSLAIQADNKILVGGATEGAGILRLNIDGSRDTSFGNNGLAITVAPTGTSFSYFTSLKIDSAGRILGTGIASNKFAVARFNPNGIQDASFGNNGVAVTDLGSAAVSNSIAIQSDGRIILAGQSPASLSMGDFTLLRYFGSACVSLVRKPFDFDGDGKSDVSVFRPDNGAWYLQQSAAGFTGVTFGFGTDKLVPADYDGDGKTDVAVFRNGTWYLNRTQLGFTAVSFGTATDIPVPSDYDGDGKADIAVFRPSNGTWYLQQSTTGFAGIAFGQNGDKPVAADYDGDGKADLAVNRSGTWYIQRSQLGFTGVSFGTADDKLVPADYDGDGKADLAVFRPSNGTWYLQQSTVGFTGVTFGLQTDLPTPADYDGDGKADIAVFRNGTWYLNRTTQGFTGVTFGVATDTAVPNVYVR